MKTSAKRALSAIAAAALLVSGAASMASAAETSQASVAYVSQTPMAVKAGGTVTFNFKTVNALSWRMAFVTDLNAPLPGDTAATGAGNWVYGGSLQPGQPISQDHDNGAGSGTWYAVVQVCSTTTWAKVRTGACGAGSVSTTIAYSKAMVVDNYTPRVSGIDVNNTAEKQIFVSPSTSRTKVTVSGLFADLNPSSGYKSYKIVIQDAKVGGTVHKTVPGGSDVANTTQGTSYLFLPFSDSIDVSGLADGTYWACALATDNAGWDLKSWDANDCKTFYVADAALKIQLSSPDNSKPAKTFSALYYKVTGIEDTAQLVSTKMTITAPDGKTKVYPHTWSAADQATLNKLKSDPKTIWGAYTIPDSGTSTVKDGIWTVTTTVTDNKGNTAETTDTFTVVSTVPAIKITKPATYGEVFGIQVPFQFKTTDAIAGTINYTITHNGGDAGFQSRGTLSYKAGTDVLTDFPWDVPDNAPNGTYTITACAFNVVWTGTASYCDTRTFVIDRTASAGSPIVDIVDSKMSSTYTVGTAIPIVITAKPATGDAAVAYSIYIYDQNGKWYQAPDSKTSKTALTDFTVPTKFTPTKAGTYNILLTAVISGHEVMVDSKAILVK